MVSDIPESSLGEAVAATETLGLKTSASKIGGGVIARTGNFGCKFALGDTKRQAQALVDYFDSRVTLDQPINIHLTGCPNSCAQHYVGDIGLLATKVDKGEDEEVEGYDLVIGGGSGAELGLGRELCRGVTAEAVPQRVEAMLRGYLAQCRPVESFHDFTNRHSVEELRRIFAIDASMES